MSFTGNEMIASPVRSFDSNSLLKRRLASNSSPGLFDWMEMTPAVAFLPKYSACGPFSTATWLTSNRPSLMARPCG